MNEHTPADEWMAEPGSITPRIGWGFRHQPNTRDKADMALVKAAPKMLEALRKVPAMIGVTGKARGPIEEWWKQYGQPAMANLPSPAACGALGEG